MCNIFPCSWLCRSENFTSSVSDPGPEGGDLREDAGSTFASSGAERNDADDVISAFLIGADERTAGIAHASRPLVRLAKPNNVWRQERSIFSSQIFLSPDFAFNLLKLVGQSLRISFDESPSGQDAVLVTAIIIGGLWHASGTCIGSDEVDGLLQLQQGDVVRELLGRVVVFVNVDLFNSEVILRGVIGLQMPFPNSDPI